MRRRSCRVLPLVAVLTSAAVLSPVGAQIVSYEATSFFPEEVGWIRDETAFPIDRFLEDGRLIQVAETVPPNGWEQDSYRRFFPELAGSPTFFAQWRVETNGPSEAIPSVAPVAVAVSGVLGVAYHFTIAVDQVRFIQDVGLPQVWLDIEPGVHTFRLELYGADEFLWYIDGDLVHSGVPEGPYPTPDSRVAFLCRAFTPDEDTICWWDYIRYGVIPADGSGDLDNNREVGWYEVYYFQECLSSEAGNWPGCAWADMDFSGGVDCDDWFLFLEAWTDPDDPPEMPECDCNPADLDCDGSVNAFDLAILLGSWGPCPDPPADCPADLDGDGFVNAFDLATLLGSWG